MSQSRELPPANFPHDTTENQLPYEDTARDLDIFQASATEQAASIGDLTHLVHSESIPELHVRSPLGDEIPMEELSGLSEHASRVSFPWDDEAATTPLPDDDQDFDFEVQQTRSLDERLPLERVQSFVPSSDLLAQRGNELGAFEEAFERAVRARGLGPGMTREEVVGRFLA